MRLTIAWPVLLVTLAMGYICVALTTCEMLYWNGNSSALDFFVPPVFIFRVYKPAPLSTDA